VSNETVWDAGLDDVAKLLRGPEWLSLALEPGLRPTGLIRSKRLLPGWTVITGYERLERQLAGLPGARLDPGHPDERVESANVVSFPYDYRCSISEAAKRLDAEVRSRLDGLTEAERRGRVIVVAHSMGGLVARYWLGPLGGHKCCRALISLGTPYRGAPKALDWVVNGIGKWWFRASRPSELIQGWPSMAELLPRYRVVWDETSATARYPEELPIPWLAKAAAEAARVHEDMRAAWSGGLDQGAPEVVPRIGWSHPTLRSARWDGTRLRVEKTPPPEAPPDNWAADLGDGTVPAISGLPVELGAHDPAGMRVQERHGRLAAARFAAGLVDSYERSGIAGPDWYTLPGEEHPVALGLDLDELYPAGESIPVAVQIRGAEVDPADVAVWATIMPDGTSVPAGEIRLVWDDVTGGFVGRFVGQRPGFFKVSVTVRDVPGVGTLGTADTVAVLEP
jgi:pimeloyl-ACP methyl ester carboxylesterase